MLFDKSSLSPYIRFGCLSVRYFLFEVKKLASKDPMMEPLLKDVTGKLLQREFYCTVAKQVINYNKLPIMYQI
jgi:deoxyribodipyrimidine photolyase